LKPKDFSFGIHTKNQIVGLNGVFTNFIFKLKELVMNLQSFVIDLGEVLKSFSVF
jgi:hypothetical protein